MPIQLRDLRALEGPNLYYPQPAVKLQIWADRDISRLISDTVKIWSQQVGVVIGALRQEAAPDAYGYLITTTWMTPLPNVGERIAEGVFADLQAAEQHDEDYSHDEALFAAIAERKREEPSLLQLQVYAEAQVRDLPFLLRSDGKVMIGSGARGYVFDPAILSLGMPADIPWDTIGTIPVVAVTGTNGKTTTTRLIAHVLRSLGLRVGHTDTDGIVIADEQVEVGDWAGWGGARSVLTNPSVDVAVLETSRGGILRRGLGFPSCNVSVVTNVSADHLGEFGIETPEQMAQVKGVIVLVTRPDGYVVLNADDPIVLGLREWAPAPVMLFSRDPRNRTLAEHLAAGGYAVTGDESQITVAFGEQHAQVALADIPITFNGAALHNVENTMAAIAACLGLGLDPATIFDALRMFTPDAANNANRLNVFERNSIIAVFDYAHNEAGLSALLAFGQRLLNGSGEQRARLLLVLGGPGDRLDAIIEGQGRLAGAMVDQLLLHEEARYLRGRAPGETPAIYRRGAEAVGMPAERIAIYPNELAALDAALAAAHAGDVVLIAAHAQRDEMLDRLQRWQRGES